jgi:hypothetical protein
MAFGKHRGHGSIALLLMLSNLVFNQPVLTPRCLSCNVVLTSPIFFFCVDDMVRTGSIQILLQSIVDCLRAEFAIKDLGELWFFLGIDGIDVKRTSAGSIKKREPLLVSTSLSKDTPKTYLITLAWRVANQPQPQLMPRPSCLTGIRLTTPPPTCYE